MKHLKLLLSAFGILISVGTALAFTTKPFGTGTVYCNSTCTDRIDYRVGTTGISNPCGGSIQEYVRVWINDCVATAGPFYAVAAGN